MLRPFWFFILGTILWSFASSYHKRYELAPNSAAQSAPHFYSIESEKLWNSVCKWVVERIREKRKTAYNKLLEEKKALQYLPDIGPLEPPEAALEGKYGVLPTIYVDDSRGAIFPIPFEKPRRFSWFQTIYPAFTVYRGLEALNEALLFKKKSDLTARRQEFENELAFWRKITDQYFDVVQRFKYIETWVPQMLNFTMELKKTGQEPDSDRMLRVLLENKPAEVEAIREQLKPHRVMIRSFLPRSLSAGTIVLPITTDIHDRKFLTEVERAFDTHWSHSPFAKAQKVQFRIEWKEIPENTLFKAGKESLNQHLSRFSDQTAAMTTGAITTHVTHHILVFGTTNITPRTIAHEMGHLLGFGDCYIRTLSSQGLFGLAVLEWNNPVYPDDLMCDNILGVARAESW